MVFYEFGQRGFVAGDIAQFRAVFERKRRRVGGEIEADEAELRRFSLQSFTNEPDDRERVGRRAQADIPNDKFAGRFPHAFRQAQLPDVQRLGFHGRPDDGMKRLGFGQRADGTRAVAQIDKAVVGWHGRILPYRSERRRHRREQEAHMQSEIHESHVEPVWQGLSPLLDEAMGHLGAKERNAILLRFFEGRTFSEVAVALDSNETAVQKRINRAVGKLQTFFARRGVKVAAGVLVGVVSANSLQAAPAGLAASVATAVTVKGAAASGSTLALIKGTLKLMAWAKVKTAMVIGACALAAGTTTVTLCNLERPVRGIPADLVGYQRQPRTMDLGRW
jgi:RNA polymerase sigma factor (sigma-70 family)